MPSYVSPALLPGTLAGRPQPRITGQARRQAGAPELTLRPWSTDDVQALVRAYSDGDIQRWHCRSLNPAEALALVEQWQAAWDSETGGSWALTCDSMTSDSATPADGVPVTALVGRVGFRRIDLTGGCAEVAYWVVPEARRRGIATGGLGLLCRWALAEIGFQRLELAHSVHNLASCRVAERSGFAREGTMRGAVLHADGWHDMHLHARLRTDTGITRTT